MKNSVLSVFKDKFMYGMHACGFAYDIMFTNSLEALEHWYLRGIKLFEVDVDVTDDGEYVACHNFTRETFIKMEIETIPEICTCKWFKEQTLYSKTTPGLTPISLEDMFNLLKEHQDLYFMIDPKIYTFEGIRVFLEKIESYMKKYDVDGERIIFETYNEDMILATKTYPGLVQYQYCVDDEMQMGNSEEIRAWDLDILIEYLKSNNIYILSYPWKFAVENLDKIKRFYEEGFVLFSKTRNDILADLLEKSHINVNIIDYLITEVQKEELAEYKNNYYEQYGKQVEKVFG